MKSDSLDLLDVSVGVSLGKDVRVFLPEDVTHSAAGQDLQTAPTLPHPERDLCTHTHRPLNVLHVFTFTPNQRQGRLSLPNPQNKRYSLKYMDSWSVCSCHVGNLNGADGGFVGVHILLVLVSVCNSPQQQGSVVLMQN